MTRWRLSKWAFAWRLLWRESRELWLSIGWTWKSDWASREERSKNSDDKQDQDWVGDGNSFWKMRRVRDCRRICWLEATEEETKREAWRWEEIDWCCKGSPFFYIYFRCGWCKRNQVRRSGLWLTPLAGSTWLYRKKETLYRLFRTHILRTQRALRSTSQLSSGCCKREIEKEATCFKKGMKKRGGYSRFSSV